jgi:hypothetical protein
MRGMWLERNREKDFVNKLVAGLRMLLPNSIYVFEDLDKEDLVSRRRAKKRSGNAKTAWIGIYRSASEVVLTAYVDPRNILRECPRCGLKMSRHKAASINIRRRYLEGGRRKKKRVRRRGSPQR